jgi:excisionase family DNA binding protein
MPLSPKELDAVADAVASRLMPFLKGHSRLIDRHSLADRLGLSVPTIERLTRSGRISVIRAGRRCLYDVDRVVDELATTRNDGSTQRRADPI